jgi:hypothetical protein
MKPEPKTKRVPNQREDLTMFRNLFASRHPHDTARAGRRPFRPALEDLEERALPGFLSAAYYGVDPGPQVTAVASFRGPGNPLDLATASFSTNGTVSVLLNNGNGTFQSPVNYSIGNSSSYPAIAVGDFNQDGSPDLVATNFGGATVSVLLNNGNGTFQPATSYTVGPGPDWVVAADFNGDSFLDLAVNNFFVNSVAILLNDTICAPGHSLGKYPAPAVRLGQKPVAAFDETLFADHGPKLDAQVLATPLNVYATTTSLGGQAGAEFGFTVTAAGLGRSTFNVGSSGAAFGAPDDSGLTVFQILRAANQRAVNGILYNGHLTLRDLAITVFDGINEAGDIG